MNDNFVSYFVAPDVTSQMINGAIQENRFYTVNQLVQPYLGQTPVIYTHSFAGIWINDVTALTIGSYNAAAPKNIFRNLNNGIISNRTNLTSLYNIFDDISSKGGYNNLTNTTLFNHTGTGIAAYGGIGYIAEIAGDALPGNAVEFTNCFRGIYVDGLQAKVYDHEFTTTNTTGINRIGIAVTNMNHTPTHIFRNTIHATQAGIRATENYASVYIYDNTITIDNPANNPFFRTGISIDNFTNALGADIDVHHNHVYMTDARRGIWLRNVKGAWVHVNDVWMQYANVYHTGGIYDYGILAENSPSGSIDCNSVTGNAFQPDPGATAQTFAFGFNLSTDNIISCNHSDMTDVGFNFAGACNNADFKTNQIDRHWAGLRLANSIFSLQIDKGNTWLNPFTYPKFGAYLDASIPVLNRIYTPTTLPFTPTNSGGGWFISPIATPPTCTTYYCTAPFRLGGDGDVVDEAELRSVNNDAVVDDFNPQVSDDTKKRLLEKLNNNALLQNTNTDVGDFYANAGNTDVGKVYEYNEKISEYSALIIAKQPTYTLLSNAMNQLLAQIRANDSIIADTTDTTYINGLLEQNILWMNDIKNIHTQIGTTRAAEQQEKDIIASDAELLNNAIEGSEIYDYNLKRINEIRNNTFEKGIPLTGIDLQDVIDIANQCPLIGGPAVYIARALLDGTNNEMVYNDEAVCASNGVTMRGTNEFAENKKEIASVVLVTPNPANTTINFTLTAVASGILRIYNAVGNVILDNSISEKQTFSIDVSNLNNGVYHFKFIVDDKTHNGTIIILH